MTPVSLENVLIVVLVSLQTHTHRKEKWGECLGAILILSSVGPVDFHSRTKCWLELHKIALDSSYKLASSPSPPLSSLSSRSSTFSACHICAQNSRGGKICRQVLAAASSYTRKLNFYIILAAAYTYINIFAF